MGSFDDFASLMEGASSDSNQRTRRRLQKGEVVEGTVIQIGGDSVYLDVGTTADARIDREELLDASGDLPFKVGDRLKATVTDARPDAPVLSVVLGKNSQVGQAELQLARESGVPVVAQVVKAVNAGLEVEVGGVRAFCPASQVELGRTEDLGAYVGQSLEVMVLELSERSVIVSRRAWLEAKRASEREQAMARLEVGAEVEGVVASTNRHGAVVDLGGIEGFVHISELAAHRVERTEDAVQEGDRVTVRVLSMETSARGPTVKLSMRGEVEAQAQAQAQASQPEAKVLTATVASANTGGIIVNTEIGQGFVPLKELELAPGSDHRRAFSPGRQLEVVVLRRDTRGRILMSAKKVAGVVERSNYREFSAGEQKSGSLGSLGELFRKRFNLPEPEPESNEVPQQATPERPRQGQPVEHSERQSLAPPVAHDGAKNAESLQPQPALSPSKPASDEGGVSQGTAAPRPQREPPPGVIRRKR